MKTIEEIRAALPADIPVSLEDMFPKLTGWGAAKENKQRVELLKKAAPAVKFLLKEGEVVRFIAKGITNLWWEQYFLGILSLMLNHTVVVVTNTRVILLHSNRKQEPEVFANQIPLTSLKKVGTGLFGGSLRLQMRKGVVSLTRVKIGNKAAREALLPTSAHAVGGLEYLCPGCGTSSSEFAELCPSCGVDVKSPMKAAMKSLVLPGLGDFYLGHRFIAVFEMLGSGLGWFIAATCAFEGLTEKDPAKAAEAWGAFAVWIVIVVIGHAIDAVLTRAQGRKGMHSLDGKFPTTSRTRVPVASTTGGGSTPMAVR